MYLIRRLFEPDFQKIRGLFKTFSDGETVRMINKYLQYQSHEHYISLLDMLLDVDNFMYIGFFDNDELVGFSLLSWWQYDTENVTIRFFLSKQDHPLTQEEVVAQTLELFKPYDNLTIWFCGYTPFFLDRYQSFLDSHNLQGEFVKIIMPLEPANHNYYSYHKEGRYSDPMSQVISGIYPDKRYVYKLYKKEIPVVEEPVIETVIETPEQTINATPNPITEIKTAIFLMRRNKE